MKRFYKGLLLGLFVLLLAGCARPPKDMWKCTATDAQQQFWVQYSPTRVEAAVRVRDRCDAGGFRRTCYVRCLPPSVRWHCIAIDKGGHAWYWNSTKRSVAVRNAREECVKNTTLGGCRVPVGNCSMT